MGRTRDKNSSDGDEGSDDDDDDDDDSVDGEDEVVYDRWLGKGVDLEEAWEDGAGCQEAEETIHCRSPQITANSQENRNPDSWYWSQ